MKLRIAVQSKGRLFDDTMHLLTEADIKVGASKRTLLVEAQNFPLEVLTCAMMTYHRAWQRVWPT